MSEVIYELKTPFQYAANNGDVQTANFITLVAPSFKSMPHVAPIKQAFMNAIRSVTDEVSEEDKEQHGEEGGSSIDAMQVMQLMYGSKEDMPAVFLHAQQLFKMQGVALVDGEQHLTIPLMEKMQFADYELLVGTYVANFIMPSLMDGPQTEPSSD